MMVGQRKTDRLAPDQRERLEAMVKEVEDNMDALVKEREAFMKLDIKSQGANQVSQLLNQPNMFNMADDVKERLDKIESKLMQRNPSAQQTSTLIDPSSGKLKLSKENLKAATGSQMGSKMGGTSSNFSNIDGMSTASKRSNVTMITFKYCTFPFYKFEVIDENM